MREAVTRATNFRLFSDHSVLALPPPLEYNFVGICFCLAKVCWCRVNVNTQLMD